MKLPLEFYRRDTPRVARELLGKRLVHVVDGRRLSGIIVETEAYLGAIDRAAHTFGGRRTKRNQSMYLAGGHAYIYMIYGLHFCINAVARNAGEPEAVLIRALEPSEGLEEMRKTRKVKNDKDLTSGPGKLCQALRLTKTQDGLDLTSRELFIEDVGYKVTKKAIVTGPRIGVDYAQEAIHWPLRFYLRDSPHVSN